MLLNGQEKRVYYCWSTNHMLYNEIKSPFLSLSLLVFRTLFPRRYVSLAWWNRCKGNCDNKLDIKRERKLAFANYLTDCPSVSSRTLRAGWTGKQANKQVVILCACVGKSFVHKAKVEACGGKHWIRFHQNPLEGVGLGRGSALWLSGTPTVRQVAS